MFRDINAYSVTLTGTQLEGRGETSPSIFEIKKSLDFGNKGLDCVHLKFLIQNVVLRISKTNISKMFPCGPSFSFFLCCWRNVYQSALVLQPHPAQKKILVEHLHSSIVLFTYSGIFSTLCNPRIFTTLPYSEP